MPQKPDLCVGGKRAAKGVTILVKNWEHGSDEMFAAIVTSLSRMNMSSSCTYGSSITAIYVSLALNVVDYGCRKKVDLCVGGKRAAKGVAVLDKNWEHGPDYMFAAIETIMNLMNRSSSCTDGLSITVTSVSLALSVFDYGCHKKPDLCVGGKRTASFFFSRSEFT